MAGKSYDITNHNQNVQKGNNNYNQSNGSYQQTHDNCEVMHDEETRNTKYGSTSESTPLQPKKNVSLEMDVSVISVTNSDTVRNNDVICTNGSTNSTHSRLGLPLGLNRYKVSDEIISTDAESVCTARSDLYKSESKYDSNRSCWWRHPQVKSHWRVFLAAFGLLIVGMGLIIMGIVVTILPEIGFQSYVFFIAGAICFIPGAYHVVYVYCAVKGRKGYDFYQLPLFN